MPKSRRWYSWYEAVSFYPWILRDVARDQLLYALREIHPLDPQPHRHRMLVPDLGDVRLGLRGVAWGRIGHVIFFSRQQAANPAVHRLSMTHIVGGSEIWWRMHSAHSLSTTPRCAIVKSWNHARSHRSAISARSRGNKDQSGLSYRLHYRET